MRRITIRVLHPHKSLAVASGIWILCILTAFVAAALRGSDLNGLLPFAAVALVPAILSLGLTPILRFEWAQLLIILAWLGLAIMACLAIAFVPMAILFLCAPAAAMLFEREKVVEAMVLAAIFAAVIYYAGQAGYALVDPVADGGQAAWGKTAGIAATIAFLIAAMYVGASGRAEAAPRAITATADTDGILDAFPGAILAVNESNNVTYVSSKMSTFFSGINAMQGRSVGDLFKESAANDVLLGLVERARRTRRPQSETIFLSEDNDGVVNLELAAGSENGRDALLTIQESANDASYVKDLQSAHDAALKDANEKALFFAGVSHELRTPLNAIIGFSDMMRSRLFGPLPGKYAEYASLIHESGQHMLDLIGDVLDMSKVEAGRYELSYDSFDAADVIRSTVKMIRPTADAAEVELVTEISDVQDDLIIEADRKAVRQILLNLVSNAIKFTPKGGRIVVSGKLVGDTLNVTVNDNGVGMSEADLKRVGQPYVQTQSGQKNEARGSGLGLSLVKKLVELHGGRFSLASQSGQGTTAEIYLPLSKDTA